MDYRRLRRYRQQQKPKSPVSMTATIVGAVCTLLFVTLLSVSVYTQGATPRILICIATTSFFVSIAAFFQGFKALRDDNFEPILRVLGLVLPGISMFGWLIVYFYGMVFG